MTGQPLVQRDDVLAAREILADLLHRTPVESSDAFSDIAGAPVRMKCEHLQRTGSFKVRGALVRLARLSEDERRRGVVAASAGNHAQGVAWAARRLGIDAVVHMPADAAIPKVEATRSYGARVVLGGDRVEDALARAKLEAQQEGRTFIHPFDHPDVVAGQGTVGLEIMEQVPDVGTILVPTGGGGLVAGIAAAVPDDVRVVAVQAERASAYATSIARGEPVAVATTRTMADGIAVARPGDVPFGVLAARGTRVLTVSEDDLSRAVLSLAERAKQVVEPAGAAGIAALIAHRGAALAEVVDPGRPVVAVLSGGNVDPIVLRKVFRHGMSAAGRYLHLRCRLSDRPGSLVELLGAIAQVHADVVTIGHVRTGADLGVDETAVDIEVVTKGSQHSREVVEHVRAAGYVPIER
ncbi:threonine ammonia-lyase [Litorihabitans aurantiacus]|uniref:threonine ammonia-lyase n=1 Tax=Litorihabitans aurantiacus TaxID=1930061 RepID=A0AA37USE6_9MICO|nr:threonine ammonia-lyase [Litorihabitans aurantiacus]GMA30530.1 threonine ammonia-lyase [Litorihabitans aurantiacus]